MKMLQTFDKLAPGYDASFTFSNTGKVQRGQVWRHLKPLLRPGMKVLELNCGTGQDAIQMAGLGLKVTATDASAEMIGISIAKKKALGNFRDLRFLQLGFHETGNYFRGERFDLIFSNFGGLNCISPADTKRLSSTFYELLNPGGRLFLVYMSKKCLWEKVYFYARSRPEKAQRRGPSGPVKVNVGEGAMEVWYLNSRELEWLYSPGFRLLARHPVGLFAPPSYLEHFFSRHQTMLRILDLADKLCALDRWADYADHCALIFKKTT